MNLDAIAAEPQFIDHLAPVWKALPERGEFHVAPELVDYAKARGIDARPLDVDALRRLPQERPVHDGTPCLVSSIGDIKIGRRIRYGPFVFLEHGAGQGYDATSPVMASYAGGPDRADNAVFLCPNEYSANRWRKAYSGARVEVVGSPRLDHLPQRVPDGKLTVAVSFHGDWPHGIRYGGNALADWLPTLPLLAREYNVIGHAHPGKDWGRRMERVYRKAGIEFVPDFDDVCRRADVYVCDNSSTIFEFAATGRPVVLLNARHWQRNGGPGLRFWDAAHVGPNVWPGDDLPAAIDRAMSDDRTAREDALEFVYAYRHGAAERAAGVIVDWLGTRQEVAA